MTPDQSFFFELRKLSAELAAPKSADMPDFADSEVAMVKASLSSEGIELRGVNPAFKAVGIGSALERRKL